MDGQDFTEALGCLFWSLATAILLVGIVIGAAIGGGAAWLFGS